MKVLVVGGGGREHAIIKKLKKEKDDLQIFCAPGNGGIGEEALCVPIAATDLDRICEYAQIQKFDLIIVAPDDPLVAGLVDRLEALGLRVFGPNKEAAQIEGSKVFAKDLMKKYDIPTADYAVFEDFDKANSYLETAKIPIVIKADGLALGKGVLICKTRDQAFEALELIMNDKKFGDAGNRVVMEEYIEGPEVSILSFCDGETIVPLPSAQDHKKAFDHDEGKNTGGMGTFSPSDKYTPEIQKEVEEKIILRTLSALKSEGIEFKGVIFFGLMLTEDGPKLLEYNARFGDPEAQVVLPKLETGLMDIIDAVIDGHLKDIDFRFNINYGVCVIIASGGYPDKYDKGYPIEGLKDVDEDVVVYHAGTKAANGRMYTYGGRVLGVTGFGRNIEEARKKAYKNVKKIKFEHMQYRTDIGIK
ncbi:MAG: phosphoribosylamine--glycine ligase [Eubacteriales bacterium]